MTDATFNANAAAKKAGETVQKTAEALHEQLVEMAAALDPFPYFLGSLEVRAVEAEPGGLERSDRGCIVVCQDGELYEFTMKMQNSDTLDLSMSRDDSVKRIDLPPQDYIPYAYNAIKEIAKLIEEQRSREKKYRF
jgi:hypothetical protein